VSFVGREPELATLRAAAGSAAEGRATAVVVAGEAGVGKTELVRFWLEGPLPPKTLVVRAQCVDLGDPGLPYLTMVDLVRAVRAIADDDREVATVLDGLPVLGTLTEPDTTGDDPVDESRRPRLFDAAATLLAEVGRVRGPVVVEVEDLQWVDSSSADFLRFLLARMGPERLLVVATVRTDGLASRPGVRRLLGELGRLPAVQRLDLAPFDATEVAEYVARLDGDHGPDAAAEVFRRTGGNPYYVETLLEAVGPGGRVDGELPRALADLLVGRLDALPDPARAVVRAAAVVAHPVPDRLLRRVAGQPDGLTAGLDDGAVDQALRVAVAEGLLVPEGDAYAFAHDLLRTAVHDDLLPGERARLHAAHAAALVAGTAGPAPSAEVAHHFAQAQDQPSALSWSVRAAEEAMRMLAPAEALQHLERALAGWPDVPEAATLAGASHGRVAVRAARAAGLAGEPARGVEWARQGVRLCDDDGDWPGGVQARAELVRQLLAVDAAGEAVRPAQEAVRLAGEAGVDAGTSALAHTVLARSLLLSHRAGEARPPADHALVEARAAHEPGLEVEALTAGAFLDELEGDRAAAAERLGTALRLAAAEGELAAELRAHYALASLHYYHGDVVGSLPVLRAAMARVTESGLRWSGAGVELRLLHAIAGYVSGDLDGSLATAATSGSRPPDVAAARLAAVSCYAAVARGLADTQDRFDRLRGSWDADPQVGLVAGGCEADHLAWEGDFAAAVAAAEHAQTHLDRVAGEGMYGGLWLSALALGALADDASYNRRRRDQAGAAAAQRQGDVLLQRVERLVAGGHGRPGDLGPEGHAWHLRAVAEHARLQGEPAVDQWQRALDAFGYGHVHEQARCRWRLADAWVAAGDRAAARPHAEAAAAAAEQMRAGPLRRAVAATVSRSRLAGAESAEDAVLTRREREVLGLVAEGLTNREIGKRLFISEKTASVHLSNVMTKLNATSRTEAVTVAYRRGLLDVV
jgi:DNA-binding CsgD family transcriptional regulator